MIAKRTHDASRLTVKNAILAGKKKTDRHTVPGKCLCGKVQFEIDFPARWAWHDHSKASRHAHGAAYATYVGSWKSRFRLTKGERIVTSFKDEAAKTLRRFCAHCGTPLFYERAKSPTMINIPRALFDTRTGREPLYHAAIDQQPEWAYAGEPLKPLRGFPGIVWQRPKRKKRIVESDIP
jgi:hypothetical protein